MNRNQTIDNTYSLKIKEKYWQLDPDLKFLNHGSFGACPIPILEYQQQIRSQMETQPVRFFNRELEPLLDSARIKLGNFLGANPEDLAFIPNATTGVNTILRSLSFNSGDEILITNHEYNACRNAVEFVAQRTGAKVKVAQIPFPLQSVAQVVDAIVNHVSKATKLVLIDHVTSPTALVLPLNAIVRELNRQGIDTLVDGAHAPGFISLNLQEIGATFYTGNCHKWLFSPKGAAFLYVKPQKQSQIRPLSISHGANSLRTDRKSFRLEFDWMGTDDPTAYLCVPKAIDWVESLLANGWQELRLKNRNLVLEARKIIANKLELDLPCPDEMIGSMASIPLNTIVTEDNLSAELLQAELLTQFKIEIPIIPFPQINDKIMRISAQIYNNLDEYIYLADVIKNYYSIKIPNI
jgi:isopenicillin-N epimerase